MTYAYDKPGHRTGRTGTLTHASAALERSVVDALREEPATTP
ncbi:hypothetical protein [Streptomyces sp. NPDC060035]